MRKSTTIPNNDAHSGIFEDFIIVSVAITSSPEVLYQLVTDIEHLSDFYPNIKFKRASDGPLTVGSIYYTRKKGSKTWVPYCILVLEPNKRISAELVGTDPLFAALRYDHRFFMDGDYTVSHEKVEYTFRYGIVGRIINKLIGKRLMKKQIFNAHLKLKEKAEKPSV